MSKYVIKIIFDILCQIERGLPGIEKRKKRNKGREYLPLVRFIEYDKSTFCHIDHKKIHVKFFRN